MKKDPFKATCPTSNGLVQFWVERSSHLKEGKIAALIFLDKKLGEEIGAAAYKNGFFLVDTPEDADQCVADMKAFKDFQVGLPVFGARAFASYVKKQNHN